MLVFRAAVFVFVLAYAAGIKIGAFNIRSFGRTKFHNTGVMTYIDGILRRYDIVLVQEIVDGQNVVIPGMLARLRGYGEPWDVKYSVRLGRSSYKEQYAFFYRTNKVSVSSPYQYPQALNEFSRPPFGVVVGATGALKKFGLLGVHIAPTAAVAEVNALAKVFSEAQAYWGFDDIMVMGDYNAGGQYMSPTDLANLVMRRDTSYQWLISDSACTTVAASSCYPYDRMVVRGNDFKRNIIPSSAKPYRFDHAYGLTTAQALTISDHFPVEVDVA